MDKHTPGPWWPDYRTSSIGCEAGWIVGTEWHDQKSDEEFGDIEADMRLVAAAPDLLAVCEELVHVIDKLFDTYPDWIEPHLDAADAAIAKARS